MPRRYKPSNYDGILAEITSANDRPTIIVAVAYLESALELAIEYRLREPANDAENGILFSDKGMLGTVFEKIWAAYFFENRWFPNSAKSRTYQADQERLRARYEPSFIRKSVNQGAMHGTINYE